MQFIPEIPPESVFNVYHPSPAALQLESEKNHDFQLQILKWIRTQPDELNRLCLLPVITTAQGDPQRLKIPVQNCAEVHAYLPTDLPLSETIHIVPDGYYWKRSATTYWTDRVHDVTKYQSSWKRLYAEQHLQDYIESYGFKEPSSPQLPQKPPPDDSGSSQKPATENLKDPERAKDPQNPKTGGINDSQKPEAADLSDPQKSKTEEITDSRKSKTKRLNDLQKPNLEELNKLLELYKPYVRKLVITNLIPLVPDGEEIKKDQAYDHLKLDLFITAMEKLEELALLYKYDPRYSKLHLYLSSSDCAALGKGLASTDHVLILRLHRIVLSTAVLESFFNAITKISSSVTLQILDFSSCRINSHGAILLSKFLHCIPNLKELTLHDNDIGSSGLSALGDSLGDVKLPLKKLDLSRNPLGDSVLCDFLSHLVSSSFIEELDLSDCMLTGNSVWKFRSFLVLNRTLRSLLLRNNAFGKKLGKLFVKGLIPNVCIEHLDTSNCKVKVEMETLTSILLELNHFEGFSS